MYAHLVHVAKGVEQRVHDVETSVYGQRLLSRIYGARVRARVGVRVRVGESVRIGGDK